jgi:hypothetical protein
MIKDLAPSESLAETAQQQSARLTELLRSKRARWGDDPRQPEPWPGGPELAKPVHGDFTPATAGLALLTDGAMLKGGPFDGVETKVPRGATMFERPAAGADGFVPARYQRTKQRTEDGLMVFAYVDASA